MWSQVLVICLIFKVSKGNLISVEKNSSLVIASYIQELMTDYETKSKSTSDVFVFKLKKVNSLSDDVDDLFVGICKSIQNSMLLHLSPFGTLVENRNLRLATFTVIISDESNQVSENVE